MIKIVCLVLAFAVVTHGASIDSRNPKADGLLVEIGKIGSKTFYEVNNIPKMNWIDAKKLCSEHEVDFGLTENNAEFQYVYDSRTGKDFWLGGSQKGYVDNSGHMDGKTEGSFEWTNGNTIDSNINFWEFISQGLCLYASGDHHTYVGNCVNDFHHALCQSTTGN